jgi:hypothetical protein
MRNLRSYRRSKRDYPAMEVFVDTCTQEMETKGSHNFEVNLGYIVNPCLKKPTKRLCVCVCVCVRMRERGRRERERERDYLQINIIKKFP